MAANAALGVRLAPLLRDVLVCGLPIWTVAAELGEHPYRTSAKIKAALALLAEHLQDVQAERRAAVTAR